jgi:CRP-like cAMP-binding protein
MDTIKEIFTERYGLDAKGFALLQEKMTVHQFPKGELLVKEGETHHSIYFIEKGAMRSFYVNEDGKDISVWFGFEGDIAASLGSFIQSKPSIENIELLEDSVLLKISNKDLRPLLDSNLALSNFGRRLAENALLEMEQQIMLTQYNDAKKKYQNLIERFPEVLQRVKLGHIASYLGITQVTLSRIRAEL